MIWGGIAATALAQVIFTYVPIFGQLFATQPMPHDAWLRVLAVGAASFLIVEAVKFFEARLTNGSSAPTPPQPLTT
jgi:hypothetical protein